MNGSLFNDMAPNAKRAFIVTIVLSAVATVLYMFCVQPAETQLAKAKQEFSDLQDKQTRMNGEIKSAGTVKKDLEDLEAQLKPYRDAMLVPLLESYSMRAKSILDPLAIGAGLDNLEYADAPFRALPLPKPMPRQLHTRAAIKVTATGSYQNAVSFLLRVEKELPLVSLQRFDIISLDATPTRQSVSFIFEWPAKGGLTRK